MWLRDETSLGEVNQDELLEKLRPVFKLILISLNYVAVIIFILKNFLRCKICCSVYTHPLVLHCAHTFCLQCIAKSCK